MKYFLLSLGLLLCLCGCETRQEQINRYELQIAAAEAALEKALDLAEASGSEPAIEAVLIANDTVNGLKEGLAMAKAGESGWITAGKVVLGVITGLAGVVPVFAKYRGAIAMVNQTVDGVQAYREAAGKPEDLDKSLADAQDDKTQERIRLLKAKRGRPKGA